MRVDLEIKCSSMLSCVACLKKHGYDFMIPHESAERYDNYGLFECFELEGCKSTGEGIISNIRV